MFVWVELRSPQVFLKHYSLSHWIPQYHECSETLFIVSTKSRSKHPNKFDEMRGKLVFFGFVLSHIRSVSLYFPYGVLYVYGRLVIAISCFKLIITFKVIMQNLTCGMEVWDYSTWLNIFDLFQQFQKNIVHGFRWEVVGIQF